MFKNNFIEKSTPRAGMVVNQGFTNNYVDQGVIHPTQADKIDYVAGTPVTVYSYSLLGGTDSKRDPESWYLSHYDKLTAGKPVVPSLTMGILISSGNLIAQEEGIYSNTEYFGVYKPNRPATFTWIAPGLTMYLSWSGLTNMSWTDNSGMFYIKYDQASNSWTDATSSDGFKVYEFYLLKGIVPSAHATGKDPTPVIGNLLRARF